MARTRDEIAVHGVRVLALPLNVCSNESVDAFHAATVQAFGRIDVLVNAAGSSTRHVWSTTRTSSGSACWRPT